MLENNLCSSLEVSVSDEVWFLTATQCTINLSSRAIYSVVLSTRLYSLLYDFVINARRIYSSQPSSWCYPFRL